MENNGLIMEGVEEGILKELKTTYEVLTSNVGCEKLKDAYYWLEDMTNSEFRVLDVADIKELVEEKDDRVSMGDGIIKEAIKGTLLSKYDNCDSVILNKVSELFRILFEEEYKLFYEVSKYVLNLDDDSTLIDAKNKYDSFKDRYDCLSSYEHFVIAALVTIKQISKYDELIETVTNEFDQVYHSILRKHILSEMLDESTNKILDKVKEKSYLSKCN